MKYIEYAEKRKHGNFDFPFAFYDMTRNHPRYNMQLHWHKEFEIIHILEGKFDLTVNDSIITLSPKDTVIINGGYLHGGIPCDCHYQCIVFDMEFFTRFHTVYHEELLQLVNHESIIQDYYPADMPVFSALFPHLFDDIFHSVQINPIKVMGIFWYLLGTLLEQHCFVSTSALPPANKKKIQQYKKILSFIETHYHEKISLEDMAACVHMTPNYFCRFFNSLTYQSPMDYLNFFRIENACEQLSSGEKSITQIAFDCGFNDLGYFIKVFKKYKGITPGRFAKEKKREGTQTS